MIDFTEYIEFFRLFDFLTFRWEFKMINFTECIEFFRLFDLLLGGQTDRFYWICWILFVFSTFRTLAGRSKWLILLNILGFFDFSTSWWEVIMINFTEYIDFFRLLDLLLGCQTDRFYWIYWIFRLLNLLLGGQNDWFYWI